MEQKQKNHIIIILLFAMTVIPFLIAWVFKQHPELLKDRTNHGDLIIPPMRTERGELSGFDVFTSDHLQEMKGRWLIINVIARGQCNEICQEAIHKSRQLRLMLNKDLTRTRRAVMIWDGFRSSESDRLWLDDKELLKIKPAKTLIDKLDQHKNGQIPDGMLFLMDPLGNLMMQYEPGFDPYQVKSDLSHLLRISQIG